MEQDDKLLLAIHIRIDNIVNYSRIVFYPQAKTKVSIGEMVEPDLDLNTIWWIPLQEDLDANVTTHVCDPSLSMQAMWTVWNITSDVQGNHE